MEAPRIFPVFAFIAATIVSSAIAEPLAIEDAVEPTGIQSVALSPNGKQLATIMFNGQRYHLALVDVETSAAKFIYSGNRVTEGYWSFDKEPLRVEWVGDDLLAVDFGLYAQTLSLDGKKGKELGEAIIGPAERSKPDSPLKLIYTDREDGDIALANARTGEINRIRHPGGRALQWAFDKHGELLAVSVRNSAFWKDVTTVTNWYRGSTKEDWQKIAEFSIKDDYWVPLYAPDKPGKLVVRSRIGRDTYALFEYDVHSRSVGEMLVGHPTQDIVSVGGIDSEAYDRVITDGMVPQQVWFDSAWATMQASVNKALPSRINILSGDPSRTVLVYSYGDVDPGTWFTLETKSMTLRRVGPRRKKIQPEAMRPMEIVSYAAADGTPIPAYLTRPAGGTGPHPAVVLIHGGPVSRDRWEWSDEVQLLASRGYVVLQPQFRGSSGFGRKFEQAGFGQWGLAMQDDISDGVRYLVREKIAAPDRICIYGASYGGYAALWGLVKTPELYRCGVSFAGVSDIEHMWSDGSDSAGSKVAREIMSSIVGNVREKQAKFAEVSPLRHAARIQAPVLLMHGKEDRRVPVSHFTQMKHALETSGKSVESELFDDEGHGIRYIHNNTRYFKRLLDFLHKHIGGLPADIPASGPSKSAN